MHSSMRTCTYIYSSMRGNTYNSTRDTHICSSMRTHIYVFPHTAMCVSFFLPAYVCVPHTAICVFILLYMCPHTAIYVSAYCYMCPHTATRDKHIGGRKICALSRRVAMSMLALCALREGRGESKRMRERASELVSE